MVEHPGRSPARRTAAALMLLAGVAVATASPLAPPGVNAGSFEPGRRVLLDAHNAYPYQGRWSDRLDRALATGLPVAVEQDLVWQPAKDDRSARSVVSHGEPFTGEEPTLADFFERIRPVVERALAGGRAADWPAITLNLDFKDAEPEHLGAIWALLGRYESWLTTASRPADPAWVAPLEVGPVLVLTGEDPAQERAFHDAVPVGGRLRLFGGYHPPRKPDEADEEVDRAVAGATTEPADVPPATSYRRWSNHPWRSVEPEGQEEAGAWTEADARRLRALVEATHAAGLWIRFYTLNGHAPGDGERSGWSAGYNFGSADAVRERWRAAIEAGVDFIATDQYEELAALLRATGGTGAAGAAVRTRGRFPEIVPSRPASGFVTRSLPVAASMTFVEHHEGVPQS